MAICPKCQLANADGAETCVRCGQSRLLVDLLAQSALKRAAAIAAGEGDSDEVAVMVQPTGGRAHVGADHPTPNPVASAADQQDLLLTPLPAPMVEPILPPAPPASQPPAANQAFHLPGGSGEVPPSTQKPAATPSPGGVPHPQKATVASEQNVPPAVGPSTVRTWSGRGATVPGSPVAFPVSPGAAPRPSAAVNPPKPDSTPPEQLVRLRLVVLRGMRIGAEYPIYEGRNTIGRFVDKPVDIDLITQESMEQTWCSRTHAAITFDKGVITVEDLNSLNGTWVNGTRIHPGQQRVIHPNDVIQVGTVQMKLVAG